jgi:hypothetical protein
LHKILILKSKKMKKLFSIIAVAALSATFVACGPSKEEIAAREKAKADSITAVEAAAAAEAEAAAKAAEAEAEAAKAKMTADSIAAATAAAEAAKPVKGGAKKPAPTKTTTPKETPANEVKPGQGRG